jgi:hypothetical protein
MPEQTPSGSPPPSGVQASLHAIAQVLRDPHPLSPQVRETLAALVDELGAALAAGPVPPEEITHLIDSTTHLLHAVQRRAAPGVLASARDRLEGAILGAEAQAPLTAGLARRLLDALANIGI